MNALKGLLNFISQVDLTVIRDEFFLIELSILTDDVIKNSIEDLEKGQL